MMKKPVEVVLASGNEGKVRELERLFAIPHLTLVSMKQLVTPGFEVDETGHTFEDNAWKKALEVCEATGKPALADDSGLEVDALDGRPGVYSARYAGPGASDEQNNELLLQELKDVPLERRGARFRCVLALAEPTPDSPRRVACASGVIEGRIIFAPRGSHGFGYDPLFEPFVSSGEGWLDRQSSSGVAQNQRAPAGITTAEMSPEEKNAISHRAAAAHQLSPALRMWLESWLDTPTKF